MINLQKLVAYIYIFFSNLDNKMLIKYYKKK